MHPYLLTPIRCQVPAIGGSSAAGFYTSAAVTLDVSGYANVPNKRLQILGASIIKNILGALNGFLALDELVVRDDLTSGILIADADGCIALPAPNSLGVIRLRFQQVFLLTASNTGGAIALGDVNAVITAAIRGDVTGASAPSPGGGV
jgi:hypothetical protein